MGDRISHGHAANLRDASLVEALVHPARLELATTGSEDRSPSAEGAEETRVTEAPAAVPAGMAAIGSREVPNDANPDLALIAAAWSGLSAGVREAILVLVRAGGIPS
jgi:hypothetical protein